MIEVIVREFLAEALDLPVLMEHQADMPKTCIILERTGGRKSNHLKSSVLAVQSYAPSLYEAATLNEKVKETMEQLIVLEAVSGVHLNSDYNFTDTETKRYRYQAVFDINHY